MPICCMPIDKSLCEDLRTAVTSFGAGMNTYCQPLHSTPGLKALEACHYLKVTLKRRMQILRLLPQVSGFPKGRLSYLAY